MSQAAGTPSQRPTERNGLPSTPSRRILDTAAHDVGAVRSVPVATVTAKRLPEPVLRGAVGALALTLGAVSLTMLVGAGIWASRSIG